MEGRNFMRGQNETLGHGQLEMTDFGLDHGTIDEY